VLLLSTTNAGKKPTWISTDAEFYADFKFFDVGLEKRNRGGKKLKAKVLKNKCINV
jgi:hypothetical protein